MKSRFKINHCQAHSGRIIIVSLTLPEAGSIELILSEFLEAFESSSSYKQEKKIARQLQAKLKKAHSDLMEEIKSLSKARDGKKAKA